MEKLPTEVIELILAQNKLNIEDVLNVRLTCSRFKDIVDNSSFIWKHKYLKIWPQFKRLFSENFSNWYEETKYIYDLKKRTVELLSTMSPRFYRKPELSAVDLGEWEQLAFEKPRSYEYVILELSTIVNTEAPIRSIAPVPITTPGNLTLKYYAIRVLKFIKQIHLSEEWEAFMKLPEEQHVLERGAAFVAQWCMPHLDIRWEDIRAKLDSIANMVKDTLKTINSNHPLFSLPKEELDRWKIQNITKNQFSPIHNRQVMQAIGETLYEQLGFHGNDIEYYKPENSYINKALETRTGLPITLAVIFESIARRVGIKCEPISFPAHFLLRYREDASSSGITYYVDVFNSGQISKGGMCPRSRGSKELPLSPATFKQVVERMVNNLEVYIRQRMYPNGYPIQLRTILELQQLTDPTNITTAVSLARDNMQHNLDSKPLVDKLMKAFGGSEEKDENGEERKRVQIEDLPESVQRILRMLNDYEAHRKQNELDMFLQSEPAPRPPEVQFAVGMIMRHLTLHYTCVIYDWDPVCKAPAEWQNQMGIHKLKFKHEQPFYNVLVHDGTKRYVAQENMVPTNDSQALYSNEDIGKYFSHFFETMLVPNHEKNKEYPFDGEIRHKFYQHYQFTKVMYH